MVRSPTPLPALLKELSRGAPLEHNALPLRLAHVGAEQHAIARLVTLRDTGTGTGAGTGREVGLAR